MSLAGSAWGYRCLCSLLLEPCLVAFVRPRPALLCGRPARVTDTGTVLGVPSTVPNTICLSHFTLLSRLKSETQVNRFTFSGSFGGLRGTFRDDWLSRREFFLGEKAQKALRLTYRSSFSSRAGSSPGGPTNYLPRISCCLSWVTLYG